MADELQKVMTEEALENNLPSQVAALSQARKDQASKVAKQRAILVHLQEEYSKGKQENRELLVHCNSLIAKLCSLEEEASKIRLNIAELEKETSGTISENENLKWQLRHEEQAFIAIERKYCQYIKKMEAYKNAVKAIEHNCLAENKFGTFKMRPDKTNSNEESQHRQLSHHNHGKADMKKAVYERQDNSDNGLDELLLQLQKHQETREKLEMANIILQKKNAALLTRLKRKDKNQTGKQETFDGSDEIYQCLS